MVWLPNQQIGRVKRTRIWAGAFLCLLFFMLATPKFPSSRESHLFADLRNFFGVPNTLNVLSNFPFLIAGVMGFVLTLQGIFFNISFRGEVWGWALFYAGITGVAFGSAYYHLKPDDDRVMWDTLPMMIAYASLFSSLLAERVDAKIGLSCLIALVSVSFLSMIYARAERPLQVWMGCSATASGFYQTPQQLGFGSPAAGNQTQTGFYLLAKFEAAADRKIYSKTHYIISGHSLEHLCSAIVPVLLSVMLMYRDTKFQSVYTCWPLLTCFDLREKLTGLVYSYMFAGLTTD
ncbi:Alkaline phytoceramidase (APHC) [Citrus sinensis]|nr:Alkaline phytoceramidase (APHC) [Citrus sinensis]